VAKRKSAQMQEFKARMLANSAQRQNNVKACNLQQDRKPKTKTETFVSVSSVPKEKYWSNMLRKGLKDNYENPMTADEIAEMQADLFDKIMDDVSSPSENATIGLDGEFNPKAFGYRKPSEQNAKDSVQEMVEDVNEIVVKHKRIKRIFYERNHAIEEATMRKLSGQLKLPIIPYHERKDPDRKKEYDETEAEWREIMNLSKARADAEKQN